MNCIDQHVHTGFSGDSDIPMEDMVKRAIELGLKEITFTDHVDYDYFDCGLWFEVDYDKYIKEIERLKEKYSEIDILLGIEIGYQPHLHERLNKLLNTYPFDFVLCSLHMCEGCDLYSGGFFEGRTQKESYRRYLEEIKYCVQNYDNFDVVGHLDVIIRYGDFVNKELKYENYRDILDDIFKIIIDKNKGIELNTSGLRYGLKDMHPGKDILKRYFELGGRIITLGSDAHKPADLCKDFEKAIAELKEIGFTKIAKFEKRKPLFIEF